MAGELVIGGGGSVVVATDALLARVGELADASESVRGIRAELHRVDALVTMSALTALDAPMSAVTAEEQLARAGATARALDDDLQLQRVALDTAVLVYGEVDARVGSAVSAARAAVAGAVGRMLPALLLMATPAALGTAALAIGTGRLLQAAGVRAPGGVGAALEGLAPVLTHPVTVAVIRALVSDADEVLAGALGLPPGAATLLGERGLGITGPATTAAVIAAVAGAGLGLFRETPVAVERDRRLPGVPPPAGAAVRLARIPTGDDRVRIERYRTADGGDAWEVYVAGTLDFDPVSGSEPFDMTSNISGVAHHEAGSTRAAAEAMRQAGVDPGDPVVFTGYSQGGLVAAQLATSGEWSTAGLVTFGAPTAGYETGVGYPALAVEHTDDLVPALAGERTGVPDAVIVERQAYADRTLPEDSTVPAHERGTYLETARMVDSARAPLVADTLAAVAATTADATPVSVSVYRAERVTDPASAPGSAAVRRDR